MDKGNDGEILMACKAAAAALMETLENVDAPK